jgi:asparagine synthetase B (glutamine-hydrolysing)
MGERVPVGSAAEIDEIIRRQFDKLYEKYNSIGILLSGGMDSAILASYLRKGSHAYTFTAQGTKVFNADEERARHYCQKF